MEIRRYGSGRFVGSILMAAGCLLGLFAGILYISGTQLSLYDTKEVSLVCLVAFLGFTFYGFKQYRRTLIVYDDGFEWAGIRYSYTDVRLIECEVPNWVNRGVANSMPTLRLSPLGQSEIYWIETSRGPIHILARFIPGVGAGIEEIARRSNLEITGRRLSSESL